MTESAPIKVLYIDDDDVLARLLQKTLARRGLSLEYVSAPDEALSMLDKGGFDVVALDHYLGTGTGLEFLAKLVASGNVTPVVYVTGSSETSVAVAALKAGASDFVSKTIGDDFPTLLISALEQAVMKARLLREAEVAQAEIRLARDRAELLLAEVNHRVANSLAMVSSLVSLQAKMITDPAAKNALAETEARIVAIASVHKRLYKAGPVGVVELDEYLAGLLDSLCTSMQAQGHGATLTKDLVPLSLNTDATTKLGVVVTELVTNAFKYAYPGGSGVVFVKLRREGERARLTVSDEGVGRGDNVSKGTGLGTRIVKAMAMSIPATLEYEARRPGTAATLTFVLDTAPEPAAGNRSGIAPLVCS
jgi:two-component sensor histidine kinase